jgi:hypothetical protein
MTTKEMLDRHDRQISGVRDLVHEGMRLLIATRKDISAQRPARDRALTKIPNSQPRRAALCAESVERVLITAQKDLMATMKRGMNGHRKRSWTFSSQPPIRRWPC